MSGSSNGKSETTPPPIAPDVQRLLDKQREARIVDDAIDEHLSETIAFLRRTHPGHDDRIIRKLEGLANKLQGEYEAQKRKERERGSKR